MDSFSDRAMKKDYFFSNRDLAKLFIPLIIEQGLEFLVGLIASIIVSRVGEAAVSGVSLVEFLMALFISIFAAFATGGGIVAGQYLGDRDSKNANKAVNQLVKFTSYFSLAITLLIFAIKTFILSHLFGTAAIAANSVGGTIIMFQGLPGISIVLGLAVIISKCVGAGDYEQAEFYKRKVSRIIHAANTLFSVIVVALMPFLMMIYDLSDQATHYVWIIVLAHGILVSIFWNSGYVLPVVFRSAGDANFPMVIGIASMLLVRVVCAYFLSVNFGMGMLGTWVVMFLDWIVKGIIYEIRYRKGTWKNYKLV